MILAGGWDILYFMKTLQRGEQKITVGTWVATDDQMRHSLAYISLGVNLLLLHFCVADFLSKAFPLLRLDTRNKCLMMLCWRWEHSCDLKCYLLTAVSFWWGVVAVGLNSLWGQSSRLNAFKFVYPVQLLRSCQHCLLQNFWKTSKEQGYSLIFVHLYTYPRH